MKANPTRWLDARFLELRPKALAALTRQFRDIDIAEEAFATACLKAVTAWPTTGLPKDPFAWLLVAGRNAGIDQLRKSKQLQNPTENISATGLDLAEIERIEQLDANGLRDDVLRLLFICCHPKLARQDQLAIALKLVVGMATSEIARALLVKPKTMEQRLTRAKKAIAGHNVPFETPDMVERNKRLTEVMLMIYLMFNEGWSTSASEHQIRLPLCDEAIRLARLLLELFPGVGEVMGLLALLLLQHSRRNARLDGDGNALALEQQNRALWDAAMINEAGILIQKAERVGPAGTYVVQANIAAVHARANSYQETDWRKIETLYAALYHQQPSPVVKLNHAVAIGKVKGAYKALEILASLSDELKNYRWFHTTLAGFLEEVGNFNEAIAAYKKAMDLQPTRPEIKILKKKISSCQKNSRCM